MTITINEEEVKKRLGTLEHRSGAVIARAINRTYPRGKRVISQETNVRYKVLPSEINKTLSIKKATQHDLSAVLTYEDKHRNIYLWKDKRTLAPRKIIRWSRGTPNVKIYSAGIFKDNPRTNLSGKNKPFIQRVKNGQMVGLFRRKTEKRDAPLIGVSGPALPQIISNTEIMDIFVKEAAEQLETRLLHEINNILKGITK